jgi:Fic family protein
MTLSFDLDEQLVKSLRDLDNKFSEAYATLKQTPLEELDALHKYARISMIGASTRIENALLTDSEVSWIDTILTQSGKVSDFKKYENTIKNKLSKDRERSIEEVAGCRSMLMLIYENSKEFFPLKEVDVRFLHRELLSPYKKAEHYAGQYKTQSNSVIEVNHETGVTRTVFKTADPGSITITSMAELISWYNQEVVIAPWPLAVSCEFVFRFLAIHPFQDGNGRLGRGLFLLSLLNCKFDVFEFVAQYLAIDRYIEKHKEEYYFTLNRCSDGIFQQNPKEYNIQYFVFFMIKVLQEALQGICVLKEKIQAEKNLSETGELVLKCFRDFPEIRLTTSKIIEETQLNRRTIIRNLNILMDGNLIQRYGEGAGTRYQLTF